MASFAPEIVEKIKEVTGKTYAQQAQFYLNAFFNDEAQPAEKEAEEIWKLCLDFEKEDFAKGKNGSELNAVQAFNLLQKRDQTKTALELKKMLREVDLDSNGEMALFEYVIHFYKRCPKEAVTRPQGNVDPIALKALEDKLESLNAEFEKLTAQLEAEKIALAKAEQAEKDAIAQEAAAKAAEQVALDEEAKAKAAEQASVEAEAAAKAAAIQAEKAEAELRVVEEEARVIEAEIKAQEQAKIDEMARLEALTTDQSVGIVKRNMAVQQLAQLKGEDSLPLQKAKLTQEAVVRKLKKATDAAAVETAASKVAAEKATEAKNAAVAARELAEKKRAEAVAAREAAEAKRAEAVAAKQAAEDSKKATEAAVVVCQQQLDEVTKEFEVMKSQSGIPLGFEWWTARTLEDKKRSLPQRMW